MPTPVLETVKQAIAKDIIAGRAVGDIAISHHVSESFVSKMKKKLGAVHTGTKRSEDRVTSKVASAPRAKRRGRKPAQAPVDVIGGLLNVLDASALPTLEAEQSRLEAERADIDSRLLRVRMLLSLHVKPPVAASMPDNGASAAARTLPMDYGDASTGDSFGGSDFP